MFKIFKRDTASLTDFFTDDDKKTIESAVWQAEMKTSGEIRIRLERRGGKDIMKSAWRAFRSMGMHNTMLQNGVLFYLAVLDRKFVILGDEGINQKVPYSFWDDIHDLMKKYFEHGFFAQGLLEGIRLSGFMLAKFFPLHRDDIGELPDAISYEGEK
jgi:uncharacterized membrane protein